MTKIVNIKHLYIIAPELSDEFHHLLHNIQASINIMAIDLTKITAAVERIETVNGSIVTLVKNLAQEVRNNANDPAELNALADRLVANAQSVADAVVANTPAELAA